MLNHCRLGLKFYFRCVNDSGMAVVINYNDHREIIADQHGAFACNFNIALPTTIKLTFSGKDNLTDTVVDSNGKIIEDKAVIIQEITLDNIPISDVYIKKYLKLTTLDQQEIYTSYIGFNGIMELDLDRPNVFLQLMKFNRLL